MKKLVILMLMLIASASAFGAAPTLTVKDSSYGDITIDSTFDGNWQILDSIIIVITDTGDVKWNISGVAVLDPGDKLYLGLGNDSANRVSAATAATTGQTNANIDTVLTCKAPKQWRGESYMPFSVTMWRGKYSSQTDLTDTLYIMGASGGSSSWEKVELLDVTSELLIVDK